MYSVLKSINFG